MKKVVLTPNPYRDWNFKYALQAAQLLESAGIETSICLAFDVDRNLELPRGVVLKDLQRELPTAELLICFGGDGTILHASKAATRAGLPVLGVNIVTMGFMAELEASDMERLKQLAGDDWHVEERMMLHVRVEHEGKCIADEVALNDAVITKGAVARVVQMSLSCDGVEVVSFSGDGVILATPTGSTAYSMSAGGPIVEPSARNIVITPICAHDLHTKTVVTAANRTIVATIGRIGRKNAFLSVDGGRALRLSAGDRVIVTAASCTTKLVRLSDRSFFDIVRNKFK